MSISSIPLDSVHPTVADNVQRLARPPFSDSVMFNSCNGLILVLIKKPRVSLLCIWNPFTRKYMELPVTPIEYPIGFENNSLIAKEKPAFAYVLETNEYKVVRVVEFFRSDGNWFGSWTWLDSETKIFSSNSNEWERIEDFPYRLSNKRVLGAHLDGILHTVVKKNGNSSWSIMGFDVKSKKHAMVPSPDLGVSTISDITVEVLGESLSLINQYMDHPKADVWVMKEYGVKDSWVKLVSVALKSFEFSCGSLHYLGSLQPVAYSKDGEEVLLNEIDERLYWYNLRSGTVREITVKMASEFYVEVCFESLVSFPGFISVGNVKGKSEGNLKKKDSKEKRSNKSRGFSMKKDFVMVP